MSLQGLDNYNGTPYLNPDAFAVPPLSPDNGFAMHYGTAPRFLPHTRGPGVQTEDFGILKRTNVTETVNIEFRADFFNLFNRVGRGDPDTNLENDTWGKITGAAHGGRTVQLALRVNF